MLLSQKGSPAVECASFIWDGGGGGGGGNHIQKMKIISLLFLYSNRRGLEKRPRRKDC